MYLHIYIHVYEHVTQVRLCELHSVYSFESLGGTSFLQFLLQPQHAPEIESLLAPLSTNPPATAGRLAPLAPSCPRLIQVLQCVPVCCSVLQWL